MKRVAQTVATKMAAAGASASGVRMAKSTRGRGHALAAAESQPERVNVADHSRNAGGGGGRVTRREPLGEQHRARALRGIEQHDQHGHQRARRAQHVGRAHVSAADTADVDASEVAPRQERKRDRPGEISDRNNQQWHRQVCRSGPVASGV
jgi:hypothetical protein